VCVGAVCVSVMVQLILVCPLCIGCACLPVCVLSVCGTVCVSRCVCRGVCVGVFVAVVCGGWWLAGWGRRGVARPVVNVLLCVG